MATWSADCALGDTVMTIKEGFSYLSNHAKSRLNERSNLKDIDLVRMLDTDSFINLGYEIGFHRQHCLLFSAIDQQYYVAVQDYKNGKVITILPLEYHIKLSWKMEEKYLTIDDDVLRRAMLAAKYGLTQSDLRFKISLKIRYVNDLDDLKIEVVKKFDADRFGYDPKALINNRRKIINIIGQWKKKHRVKEIVDVYTSMGRKADLFFIDADAIENLNS